MLAKILTGDCADLLQKEQLKEAGVSLPVDLAFLDPPFNQGKDYNFFDDEMSEEHYWSWMSQICSLLRDRTADGGAIYFMQREKNAEHVLRCLRETGWTFQNLIIWMKRTSAVPGPCRYGKQYQIIVFATNGPSSRVFHRLRVDIPLRPGYRQRRESGVFVTDCWDDIRELTSGYFAGEEALRTREGERFHKQQSPIALLLRIILSSTDPEDLVLDPFAGTGTTLVTAEQLGRRSVGIEIDPKNIAMIKSRLTAQRAADSILSLRSYYRFTPKIDSIWPGTVFTPSKHSKQIALIQP